MLSLNATRIRRPGSPKFRILNTVPKAIWAPPLIPRPDERRRWMRQRIIQQSYSLVVESVLYISRRKPRNGGQRCSEDPFPVIYRVGAVHDIQDTLL